MPLSTIGFAKANDHRCDLYRVAKIIYFLMIEIVAARLAQLVSA